MNAIDSALDAPRKGVEEGKMRMSSGEQSEELSGRKQKQKRSRGDNDNNRKGKKRREGGRNSNNNYNNNNNNNNHNHSDNNRNDDDNYGNRYTQRQPSDKFARTLTAYSTFEEMGLKPLLLKGVYAYGYEKPSAIQQRAIKPIIQGRDVIAQSQSGTGKTAVFSISALQIVDERSKDTQVLILSPTRELADQSCRVINALGDFMSTSVHACVGGKSLGEDLKRLDTGVQVVSGTPGRVFDLIRRQSLSTKSLKALIIDEADEMLDKGFKDQIYDIYRYLPSATQVVLVSATLPPIVMEMTQRFMNEPVKVLVKRDELTLEGIRQFYVGTEKEEVSVVSKALLGPFHALRFSSFFF